MNIKTNLKAGSCYPGYQTSYRWGLVNGQWQCLCTTDYGCSSGLMATGDAAGGAPPPPAQ